jgi:hypothetical protein
VAEVEEAGVQCYNKEPFLDCTYYSSSKLVCFHLFKRFKHDETFNSPNRVPQEEMNALIELARMKIGEDISRSD